MGRERAGALSVPADIIFARHEQRIADLAARNRLPAMYGFRGHVEAELPRLAAHEVRAGDQPQDRQGAGVDDSAVAACAGGRDHPVTMPAPYFSLARAAV